MRTWVDSKTFTEECQMGFRCRQIGLEGGKPMKKVTVEIREGGQETVLRKMQRKD